MIYLGPECSQYTRYVKHARPLEGQYKHVRSQEGHQPGATTSGPEGAREP